MRRLPLVVLLTLSGAASAALPRVALQAPLMPPTGPAAAVLPVAGLQSVTALLERLTLEPGGAPEHGAALALAVQRMLETPTGISLAEQFIAEGAVGAVRFEAFDGSRIYDAGGRKLFYAPRAFAEWKNGRVEVRLNQDYLGTDARFQEQDLPPTLAHELFGHGLWYARAARENALLAFHHHELNETNARLVGWLVDYEMDRRFEGNDAWNYLQDPAQFLRNLKLNMPYYALTFSNEELARPIETLEERLLAARAKRRDLEVELANHRSWNAVIDHFVRRHGLPERRFAQLRRTMADTDQIYRDQLTNMDAILSDLDGAVARMKTEADRRSQRYLQRAASHPLFIRLEAQARENSRRLMKLASQAADAAPSAEASQAAKSDQFTFEDLMRLYREDLERRPGHWEG